MLLVLKLLLLQTLQWTGCRCTAGTRMALSDADSAGAGDGTGTA